MANPDTNRHTSKDYSNFTSTVLSAAEKQRLDRQLRLPNWNQEVLKQSTVVLVGVGGLGVEVAKNLAMVGVGHMILIDMDTIEHSNLNRQVLFIGAKEGASKAKVAASKLRELNPHIQVNAYHSALQDVAPEVFATADLLIAGLDSVEARQEINRRAIHFRKPLIDAGTATYNGHVFCIFPFDNACLDCDPLREREQEDLGACTLVGKPRKPLHCVFKGQLSFEQEFGRLPSIKLQEIEYVRSYANALLRDSFPDTAAFTVDQVIQLIDRHEPTVITINCVLASYQSQEAVKILHHLHSVKHQQRETLGYLQKNYLIYNGLTGKFYELEKPRNPKCMSCGSERTPILRIKVTSHTRLQTLLEKLIEKKKYRIDAEFPPTIFKIDTVEGLEEIDAGQTIDEARLRDYETLYFSGFEEDKSVYVQLRL